MMTGGAAAAPRWDHNVITPGTPFMAKLASYLRRFVAERQRYGGAVWQRLAVVVDDSSSPVRKGELCYCTPSHPSIPLKGEGEHKLVEYIRNWNASSDFNPGQSHSYGIMLQLTLRMIA